MNRTISLLRRFDFQCPTMQKFETGKTSVYKIKPNIFSITKTRCWFSSSNSKTTISKLLESPPQMDEQPEILSGEQNIHVEKAYNLTNKKVIAIVGRPNVGKSTLFNRLVERGFGSQKQRALISPIAGTTRDRSYGNCLWLGREFLLVDTAGLSFSSALHNLDLTTHIKKGQKYSEEQLSEHIQHHV